MQIINHYAPAALFALSTNLLAPVFAFSNAREAEAQGPVQPLNEANIPAETLYADTLGTITTVLDNYAEPAPLTLLAPGMDLSLPVTPTSEKKFSSIAKPHTPQTQVMVATEPTTLFGDLPLLPASMIIFPGIRRSPDDKLEAALGKLFYLFGAPVTLQKICDLMEIGADERKEITSYKPNEGKSHAEYFASQCRRYNLLTEALVAALEMYPLNTDLRKLAAHMNIPTVDLPAPVSMLSPLDLFHYILPIGGIDSRWDIFYFLSTNYCNIDDIYPLIDKAGLSRQNISFNIPQLTAIQSPPIDAVEVWCDVFLEALRCGSGSVLNLLNTLLSEDKVREQPDFVSALQKITTYITDPDWL